MGTDTWAGSALWGRVGAGILAGAAMILGAYGMEFGADDQVRVYGAISGILSGVGAVMAVVSKWREQKDITRPIG